VNLQELIADLLDYVRGMWRYRWWAVIVAWVVAGAGTVYVYAKPDVYRASTKVFVDTNGLIQPLMRGLIATQNTLNQVQILAKALLTRPNMEKVAHETDLDLRAHSTEQMEKLITHLQRNIYISGGQDNIFTITFEDPSRDKARAVVASVLDTFVEGALGDEGSDADVTEKALANELQVHEQRLRDSEEALAKFKQDNIGYMPGQYGDYYERLQAATVAVSATEDKLKLAAQRREALNRQIRGEDPVIGIMPGLSGGLESRCSQGIRISELQTELGALRVQYTDKHPRVVALNDMIGELQKACASEVQAAQAAGLAAPVPAGQSLEANPVYQNMKIQLSDAEVQIAELTAQLNAQQTEVATLKRDVDKITEVEAQLKQLTRDYDVVQARHKELLERWEDLQAKKRLDPVTDKVKFRRIEPPFALADPVGPNRPLWLLAVLVVALGAGLALAFALNQLQPVFFRRAHLNRVAGIPVLGSITMILTPDAEAQRKRDALGWGTATLLLVAATGVSILFADPAGALVRGLVERVVS
jgi:polysaccharide chain length determinant protein (PEP-CTERM system associated)